MVAKRRLDALLTDRGLFETRSRAAAAVLAGEVRLGADGRCAAQVSTGPSTIRSEMNETSATITSGA